MSATQMEVVCFIAGETFEDAVQGLVFLDDKEAEQFTRENGVDDVRVWSVTATIDFSSAVEV